MHVIICENPHTVDTLLQPPVATMFDAVSSLVSALMYLTVALAAVGYAPRDVRVRLFLAVALASAAPYGITSLMWLRGSSAALSRPVILATALSLMIGSLTLLHFTQVFPWRRPWIRAHGRWLVAGYAAAVLVTAGAAWLSRGIGLESSAGSEGGGLGSFSIGFEESILILLIAMPL